MIDQELDITNMLKTFHKLKAGVIALTEKDEALQTRMVDLYLNSTLLYPDTCSMINKSNASKFFETNDRNKIIAMKGVKLAGESLK
jgi:hypothetical protein